MIVLKRKLVSTALLAVIVFAAPAVTAQSGNQHSAARIWNEALLHAIRNDFARPTSHARNLFHTSAAMYDAWAVYNPPASPYFLGQTQEDGFHCNFPEQLRKTFIRAATSERERQRNVEVTLSAAMHRLISHRFKYSPGVTSINERVNQVLDRLQISLSNTHNNDQGPQPASPESLGAYLADCIIEYGRADGANEDANYKNHYYRPVNPHLDPNNSGNQSMRNPDRWQPLELDNYVDQANNPLPTPEFLGAEWGHVLPFALTTRDSVLKERDHQQYRVYLDPGAPSLFSVDPAEYAWGHALVAAWSSHLDPADGIRWDISPRSLGASGPLPHKTALKTFYRTDGGSAQIGRQINPVTNRPYQPNHALRGDYTRVVAEFWADGPDSETPPGHWFTILNDYVLDHPQFKRQYCGSGAMVSALEFDIRSYFVLGGAMHDAAIAAWSIKGYYDYARPISALRYLAQLGQSTDTALPGYHRDGIALMPGVIEVVQPGDKLSGTNNANVGKIKVRAWRGPDYVANPKKNIAGVGWILLENWWPYQRPSFVTPPFSGYVSGHSTFSRTAAEVLTALTGSEYFPGGLAEFVARRNDFLVFEQGPSEDVVLQWATFQDASDQSSLSRIWGGIHPPVDDVPGRQLGIQVAARAIKRASSFFRGNPAPYYEVDGASTNGCVVVTAHND